MRHRALQTGRIYVNHNVHDRHLSVDELRQMVGAEGEILCPTGFDTFVVVYEVLVNSGLSRRVDWLPTVFFTHSAADIQWPELARLLCPDDPECSGSRSKAVVENPCLADWFFYHRITKFMDMFYKGILKYRGSPTYMV